MWKSCETSKLEVYFAQSRRSHLVRRSSTFQ